MWGVRRFPAGTRKFSFITRNATEKKKLLFGSEKYNAIHYRGHAGPAVARTVARRRTTRDGMVEHAIRCLSHTPTRSLTTPTSTTCSATSSSPCSSSLAQHQHPQLNAVQPRPAHAHAPREWHTLTPSFFPIARSFPLTIMLCFFLHNSYRMHHCIFTTSCSSRLESSEEPTRRAEFGGETRIKRAIDRSFIPNTACTIPINARHASILYNAP